MEWSFYSCKVVSLESLNQHMDWTSDYFKKLRDCLEEQKKEVSYSFVSESEDESEVQTKYVTSREVWMINCLFSSKSSSDYQREQMYDENVRKKVLLSRLLDWMWNVLLFLQEES